MLHRLLAGAFVALLLSASPLSSPTAQRTGPVPDCLTGKAAGTWDLPAGREAGRVRGRLLDVDGLRFALEARLTPVPMLAGLRGGRIDGVLYPVTSTGRGASPIAEVHGTYVVGLDSRGQFDAVIVALEPLATARPNVLGKLTGMFADQELRDTNTVGRFVGSWSICR